MRMTPVIEGFEVFSQVVDCTNVSTVILKLFKFVEETKWTKEDLKQQLLHVVRYLNLLFDKRDFVHKLKRQNNAFRTQLLMYISELKEIVIRCSKRYNCNVRVSRTRRLKALLFNDAKSDLRDLKSKFSDLRDFLDAEIQLRSLLPPSTNAERHQYDKTEDIKEEEFTDERVEEEVVQLIAGETDLEQYPEPIRVQLNVSQEFIRHRRAQNQSLGEIFHDEKFVGYYHKLLAVLDDEEDSELVKFGEQDVLVRKIRERYVGKGRFGGVWKGTLHGDVATRFGQQEVAVKVIDTPQHKFQGKRRAQFRHEVEQCLRIDALVKQKHFEHIARFHGLVRLNQRANLGIVMELCHGGSIADRIHTRTITEPQVVDFSIQIARGLQFLHDEIRVIHGDLKPSNCLLTGQGTVKLTGFGKTHEFKGGEPLVPGDSVPASTLAYIAPEVHKAAWCKERKFKASSGAVDVYALGMTMWSMVTLEQPFHGASQTAIPTIVTIQNERPPLDHRRFSHSARTKCARQVVLECFNAEPEVRPSPCDIIEVLAAEQPVPAASPRLEEPSESEIEQMSVDGLRQTMRKFRKSETVQQCCAKSIENLVRGRQAQKDTLVAQNIVDDLTLAMRGFRQSEMVQGNCALVIARLACSKNKDHIDTMMANNVADDLILAMRGVRQSEMVQGNCALAIAKLAALNNKDRIDTMMANNVADDLILAMRGFGQSEMVQGNCALAIAKLAALNNKGHQDFLMGKSVVDDLVQAMRDSRQSQTIQQNCALAIGNLASSNENYYKDIIMEKDVVGDLILAMSDSQQSEMVKAYCAFAIMHLVWNNQSHINTIMAKNVADVLIEAVCIFPQSEKVQERCAFAVHNLASRNLSNGITQMAKLRCNLIQAMRELCHSELVKGYCALAIGQLARQNQDYVNTWMARKVADDFIQTMRLFPQSDIAQQSCASRLRI